MAGPSDLTSAPTNEVEDSEEPRNLTVTAGPAPRASTREVITTGDRIARYVIEARLGAGGMGEVYAAHDPELDRRIAVKVIRPGTQDERHAARLLAEAQALARLSHPNVVAVYDVGAVAGGVFIAMELVEGITLTEWLRTRRGWREIIEVFTAVGRGLEAAHRAGLVHRDVKPDNVVLGADRRVRLIDFGVAWHGERATSRTSSPVLGNDVQAGTPAFMAPEQFTGDPVTPATDQFSFAVALYLALWGRRPFAGTSSQELAAAVTRGELAPPPDDKSVPPAIRAAIVRALSTDPAQRFSSMAELLARIQPRTRTRWIVAAAFAAVGGGALAIGLAAGGDDDCAHVGDRANAVWTARRAQLERAFAGAPTWTVVASALDRYAGEWTAAATAACRAGAPATDPRMACLDSRLRQLDATITVLLAGDVDDAPRMAVTLPPIAPCENVTFASATPPPDADADTIRAIEDDLARIPALRWASRFDDGRDLANEVIASAQAIGWTGAVARALVGRGMIEYQSGTFASARETLFEAVEVATAARDGFARAQAWVMLVGVEAVGLNRPLDALKHEIVARAEVERAGSDPELVGLLAHERGNALWKLARFEEAVAAFREARAILERAVGPRHPWVAMARGSVGNALRDAGKHDESVAELEALLAFEREVYGERYPSLGHTLNNLGLGYEEQHRYADAEAMFAKSLAAYETRLGKTHPFVGWPLTNLARVEQRRGNFAAADVYWQRAYDVKVARAGEDDPDVTSLLLAKLLDRANRGLAEEADALAQQVLGRYEAQPTPERADALGIACELRRRRGDHARAEAACTKALELAGAEPERTVYIDQAAAVLAVDRASLATARKHLQAAESALAKVRTNRPLAEAAVARARAHVYALEGEPAKAAEAARTARALYTAEGQAHGFYVDELERFTR